MIHIFIIITFLYALDARSRSEDILFLIKSRKALLPPRGDRLSETVTLS